MTDKPPGSRQYDLTKDAVLTLIQALSLNEWWKGHPKEYIRAARILERFDGIEQERELMVDEEPDTVRKWTQQSYTFELTDAERDVCRKAMKHVVDKGSLRVTSAGSKLLEALGIGDD